MRRAKYGVGAVVVVGVAYWLSNLFNVGGLGGGGTTVGLNPTGENRPDAEPGTQTPLTPEQVAATRPATDGLPDTPATSASPTTTSASATGSDIGTTDRFSGGPVLELLHDDRQAFVRQGTAEPPVWTPADLQTITVAARQATGDARGIKVRVFRKSSSRAAAEDQLTEALQAAGITDAEIEWPEVFVK